MAWTAPDAKTAPPAPAVRAGRAGSDPAVIRIALMMLIAFGCSLVRKSSALHAFSSHTGAFVTTGSGRKKERQSRMAKQVDLVLPSSPCFESRDAATTASTFTLVGAACLGDSSRSSLLFLGQKKSVFDLDGRLGGVVDDASSTEFLRGEEENKVLDRGFCFGGVTGAGAGAGAGASSFFLINQRLRPLPWTLIVSVAAESMFPDN